MELCVLIKMFTIVKCQTCFEWKKSQCPKSMLSLWKTDRRCRLNQEQYTKRKEAVFNSSLLWADWQRRILKKDLKINNFLPMLTYDFFIDWMPSGEKAQRYLFIKVTYKWWDCSHVPITELISSSCRSFQGWILSSASEKKPPTYCSRKRGEKKQRQQKNGVYFTKEMF